MAIDHSFGSRPTLDPLWTHPIRREGSGNMSLGTSCGALRDVSAVGGRCRMEDIARLVRHEDFHNIQNQHGKRLIN